MNQNEINSQSDEWSDWLLHRRHADDPEYSKRVHDAVKRIRNHLLDGANLRNDIVLADIGAGDGLIAFEAINRIGPSLHVIYTDISAPLLRHAETLATERGVRGQCTFVQCSADKLNGIEDASVDVVTSRAVLAYVADKPTALREFLRVLKPGGRLSIAEPVFRDNAFENIELKKFIESQPTGTVNPFLPLLHRWRATQFPDTLERLAQDPLTNYSERELFRYVVSAGFAETRMEFHVEILPCINNSWEVFLGTSPHPLAPSLKTILDEKFSAEERQFFEQTLRPIVEQNQATSTERNAYITAIKPRT
jgi:ubiquinone/menaquinone biosynthesis C-methylase UbiE